MSVGFLLPNTGLLPSEWRPSGQAGLPGAERTKDKAATFKQEHPCVQTDLQT